MPSSSPERRPVDLTSLDIHATRMKLRAGVVLPASKKKNVLIPRESFVPILQADVGSTIAIAVYRYRLLLPIAQTTSDSNHVVHRIDIASDADFFSIRNTLIGHFGGVTVLHQPPAPAFGAGARDPSDVGGTLELNEHAVFEVYAAPVQEADDYFRMLRFELQDALQEGVILIERQQATLL